MSAKLLMLGSFCQVLLLALAAGAEPRGAPTKIYIDTDLEGASGVYKFAQTRDTTSPLYREACQYLMDDIAAVIHGLRDAGVKEVVVLDGHGAQAFVPHWMVPGAKYITGLPRPHSPGGLNDLDGSYGGMVMVGFHAMMGTPDGVLHHTQSSRPENRYWYNGVESGELAQDASIAGAFGVPPIMVTGDEATCREARKFFGEHCVTVAVKKGLSRESAMLYPFEETRQALYEGAKRAVAAMPLCRPYTIKAPIHVKKQFLIFDSQSSKGRLMTKEGDIADPLHILDF